MTEKKYPKKISELVGFLLLLLMFLLFVSAYFSNRLTLSSGSLLVQILMKLAVFGLPTALIVLFVRRGNVFLPNMEKQHSRAGTIVIVFSTVGVTVIMQLLYAAVFPSAMTAIGVTKENGLDVHALMFCLHVFLPALAEEVFFRGTVLRVFRVFRSSLAILISALAFGLMHFSVDFFPLAFVCGLLFGAAYIASGSLTAMVAIHLICNGFWFAAEVVNVYAANAYEFFMRIALAVCVLLAAAGLPYLKNNMNVFFGGEEEQTVPSAQVWTLPLILFFVLAISIQLLTLA